MPLIDLDGTTIGLVDASNVNGGPVTTYTYDPSGTPTLSGSANQWPFLYHGMEQEGGDPFPHYYYTGNGQFYNTQMVRSLSEVGQTGTSGPGACSSGSAIGAPGSSGSDLFVPSSIGGGPESANKDAQTTITVTGAAAVGATWGAVIGAAFGSPGTGFVIGAAVGAIVGGIVSVFEDLFGGGSPPTPRQLLHNRHPLYADMLGVSDDLIVDEVSAGAPEIVGDQHPNNKASLQNQPQAQKELCQEAALAELEKCFAVMEAPSDFPKAAAAYVCATCGEETGGLACAGFVAMEIPTVIAEGKCLYDYRNQIKACQ